MKRIEWKQKALRQLRKIKSRQDQNTIYKAVGSLVNFPQCNDVKKIKTTDIYRLKVGKWRVFFSDTLKIVKIEEGKKRNERTYK